MNGQYHRDMTAADLSRDPLMSATQGRGLSVSFYYENVAVESVDPELNGQIQRRLCIRKKPLGDKYTEATAHITPERAAREFPREYAMFTQYEDIPTSGTPLRELPGATQSSVAMMMLHGLVSIEDMREISEDQAAQIGIEATRLRKLAMAWLERKEGNTDTIDFAARLSSIEAALKAERDRASRMEQQNIRLQAALEAVKGQTGAPMAQSAAGVTEVVSAETFTIRDDDGFMGGGGMSSDRPDTDYDPLADED